MPIFRPYDQNQVVFRELSPAKLLDDDHPAKIVDLVVEQLDLETIYAAYKDEGNIAYHPKMMLKVLFYSYLRGTMSCRKMEDGLQYRADYVFLSGDQVPDFRTLNNFRKRHFNELVGIFTQIVVLCAVLGMVDFEHLAIDGQKIHACANFRNNLDRKRMEKQKIKVRKGMEKLLARDPSAEVSRETIEKRYNRLACKLEKLERAKAVLETRDEKACVNIVDDEAVAMKHKDGRTLPSYNHQSAVDGAYGVTCAVATTQEGDKPADLFELVDQATKNVGKPVKNVLADAGFADYKALQTMAKDRPETYCVPDKLFEVTEAEETARGEFDKSKFAVQDDGTVVCPQGHAMTVLKATTHDDGHTETVFKGTMCGECPVRSDCTSAKDGHRSVRFDSREPYREEMRERLRSEEGREAYRKRQGIVESTHGHDQKNLGWRQHHLRGLKKARGEFLLIRIASNIGKIARYKARQLWDYARNGNQIGLEPG